MIYVTSDLHGKCEHLKKLLSAAKFSDSDWLYILGDVIDRNGNGGVDILKWLLLQPNVQLILGNHEHMLLANRWMFEEVTKESVDMLDERKMKLYSVWESNGGGCTMKALSKESPETRADILAYLDECPLFESVSAGGVDYILVHAGLGNFSPVRPLSDYTPNELLWVRPDLRMVYSPDCYKVIFGHTPTGYYSDEYKNRMIKTASFFNIDTGAARKDGSPMLLCLDTLTEYYIEPTGEVTVK